MLEINALGDTCPIPVIKTKNALKDLKLGEAVTVLVDNVIATQNLEKLAKETGCAFSLVENAHDNFSVTITKVSDSTEELTSQGKNTVVAVTSDKMGEGNEELGRVLIKGFIYALTELDNPPSALIFYNGGAKLTAEGSDSLDDLNKLLEKGCEIMTCGTCLNYYGLSDKLKIGGVSNMYSIVEKLMNADKIIRP